ncbi:MAG: hypothetical protein A2X42_00245 [Candidatus Margulisbacteria bacterium GWF2_38_17]|nr:MAG: hypothetical protein A2X42_00245 [Candidatus Margulisbacteria bacterium GWF2_38_17]OGI05953.1 MAG: hypothetical protein A2X41_07740 [Candidatus Margulisbacteria bacterium GWE2_39_32]
MMDSSINGLNEAANRMAVSAQNVSRAGFDKGVNLEREIVDTIQAKGSAAANIKIMAVHQRWGNS